MSEEYANANEQKNFVELAIEIFEYGAENGVSASEVGEKIKRNRERWEELNDAE